MGPQDDLGQHLLTDAKAIGRVVDAARLKPGDRVLDAGAGAGALSRPVAEAVGSRGLVYAVELDPAMLDRLRCEALPQVRVVEADLVDMTLPAVDAVVANPPFKIAAHFLERIVGAGVARAVLVLPRELIDRIVASPGTERYGKLTVRVALLAHVEDLGPISRHAFTPAPAVTCGFVRVTAREAPVLVDRAVLDDVLEHARGSWERKAKQTFDSLARLYHVDSAGLTKLLRDNGWADERTSALPPEAFAAVARYLEERGQRGA